MSKLLITEHAWARAKERLNMGGERFEQLAHSAYNDGLSYERVDNESLARYMADKADYNQKRVRVLNDIIWVFTSTSHKLLTVYPSPVKSDGKGGFVYDRELLGVRKLACHPRKYSVKDVGRRLGYTVYIDVDKNLNCLGPWEGWWVLDVMPVGPGYKVMPKGQPLACKPEGGGASGVK